MKTRPSDMCGQLYLQVRGGFTLSGFINQINMRPSLIIFGIVVGMAASDIAAIVVIDAKVLFPAAIVSTLALLIGLAGESRRRGGMQTRATMSLHRGSLLPGDPDEAPEDDRLANATR